MILQEKQISLFVITMFIVACIVLLLVGEVRLYRPENTVYTIDHVMVINDIDENTIDINEKLRILSDNLSKLEEKEPASIVLDTDDLALQIAEMNKTIKQLVDYTLILGRTIGAHDE